MASCWSFGVQKIEHSTEGHMFGVLVSLHQVDRFVGFVLRLGHMIDPMNKQFSHLKRLAYSCKGLTELHKVAIHFSTTLSTILSSSLTLIVPKLSDPLLKSQSAHILTKRLRFRFTIPSFHKIIIRKTHSAASKAVHISSST